VQVPAPMNPRYPLHLIKYQRLCVLDRGRELYERIDGVRLAAFDSSFTAGVFELETGDTLYVKPDDYSATCSVISHHDKTFLGAIRLQMSGLPPTDHS